MQLHLTGQQQLAAPEELAAGADLLREVAVVARVRGVDRPDLAAAEPEAGRSGVQHMGGVGAGASATVLPQVGADRERTALRGALLRPAAGEIQELIGLGRDGQRHGQLLEPVGDRKSTRLNSSHVAISYAVFCLKKKKKY